MKKIGIGFCIACPLAGLIVLAYCKLFLKNVSKEKCEGITYYYCKKFNGGISEISSSPQLFIRESIKSFAETEGEKYSFGEI